MKEKNFGQLGMSFQQSLIKTIIEDKKYGENIIDVIESKYFDNNSFKYIMENLKELYKKYEKIPTYDTLQQKIMSENINSDVAKVHIDTLEIIKNLEQSTQYVKDTALNFCKQQNLRRVIKTVNSIIDNGQFEEYSKIEEIVQKALQVGSDENEPTDVFDDIEGALRKDFRHPIPTGIDGIDSVLKGGIGKGELAVLLAPTGVGKTTYLTKVANSAYNYGCNVLQIIFEDNKEQIKRKHYTIWSGIAPDDQSDNEDQVLFSVREAQNNSNGVLKILKLDSDSLTISGLKTMLRKYFSNGFNIDLLVLDYVDCVIPERSYGDEWKGEGSIMRGLDGIASEFNIAIWTATQGNRESIASEVVTTNQMGGSIKKAQVGHVIISVGKTLEQKEHNLATITILKSRIGRDGIIFQNCTYNNEYLDINTDSQNTLLGHEEQKNEDRANRVKNAFLKRQNMKKDNNTEI